MGLLEVFLSPCSDLHDRITSDFNAVLPKARRSWVSNIDFLCSEMSPDSLNLLMILFIVEEGIFNVFAI